MIKKIVTKSNTSFLYDADSYQLNNGIISSDFVILKCIKMFHKKLDSKGNLPYSYEYPSLLFKNKKMCKDSNVLTNETANDVELEIFKKITSKSKLGKDLNEYLRANYLTTMNEQDELELDLF